MTTITLPTGFAAAAYLAALTGLPRPPADAEAPAPDDRGSLVDLVIGPVRQAASLRSALRMRPLAALPIRQCLPLTAASGC